MKTQSGKTPVSIITGFLGSGKTTLINHILTADHGFKIAVIINEFGEIGIDGDLIVKDENSILELSNGCLCCAIIGDLTQIVIDLEKSGKDFDYLLIETTGIANPAPVAEVFYFDPRVNSKYFVDGIVTVVDPINLEIDIEDNEECYKQIAFADLFVLNKADIVNESQLKKSKALLKLVNPVTPYIPAEHGKVPIEKLLQLGSKPNANILENYHEETHEHSHSHHNEEDHSHHHHDKHQHEEHHHHHDEHQHEEHHHHSTPVESESILIEGAMDQGKLRYWLSTLIFDRSDLIYRMKGIVNVFGSDQKLIFQSVHRLFEDGNGGTWAKDEARQTKIVFIGEKLDREELLQGLQTCLVTGK